MPTVIELNGKMVLLGKPKCMLADSCTNDAAYFVQGKVIKPVICCVQCVEQLERMFPKAGSFVIKKLKGVYADA